MQAIGVVDELAERGILILSLDKCGLAEEMSSAYMNVTGSVYATDRAGWARKIAGIKPVICVKG